MIRTELLSDRIAERVFERIQLVTAARLSKTLTQHLADPDVHSNASILFEHAIHLAIRKGLILSMTRPSFGVRTDGG
jgi:hypothetical protein